MSANEPYDVVILGGGLAGLTLTRQLMLRRPGTRLAILEKRVFPVPEAAHKVGESTVEIGAHYFGEQLGLKKHLTEHQLPKFGLRFFFKESHQSFAEGTEVGGSTFFAAPSYQVDRGRFENYLAELVQSMGATILSGARCRVIDLCSHAQAAQCCTHLVRYEKQQHESEIAGRWLVDASGRHSFLKRKLQLDEDLDHTINAVWFRIDAPLQVDQWCADRDWQALIGKLPRRWLSTNHLMGDGYWVWLIPLASGGTSVGIVADPRLHPLRDINTLDKALDWLDEHEPECGENIRQHRDKTQDFLAIKNMARGARQVYSADRWALTGEAAAFLDPLYSPGSDFIAIGNTMITKLIEEDLAGRPIEHVAPTLQSVFLTLFQNNLLTYRDQYPIFGNPRIMAVKFVWDYAVYWGFPALLYFNDKLTDVRFIQSISRGIAEIRKLNQEMQEFFREWHVHDPVPRPEAAFVDQSQIELMTRMNAELCDRVDEVGLKERFEHNVHVLRELTQEITSRVGRNYAVATSAPVPIAPDNLRLANVFETLSI